MDTIYGIDIGSNSVRLVKIKNGKTMYKVTDTTQVSQDLSKNGFLLREAMDRTLSAVANFTKIAKKDALPILGKRLLFCDYITAKYRSLR